MKSKKNIVIKLGTTSIIKDEELNLDLIESLATSINEQKQNGFNFVIVTSGAVQLGANELNLEQRPTALKSLQVASSVGQIALINSFKEVFKTKDMKIAQVLMSKNVLEDRNQFINTSEALNELITQNIIPVINENDIVATEELKFGDNDRLSAIVAIVVKAEKLVLITNQEGLFDSDPQKSENAEKINYIEYDSEELADLIPTSATGEGVGGFSTKIMASQMAGFSGIPTQIISWSEGCIHKVINNEDIGTLVKPSSKKVKLKKLWIAYGMPVVGRITIDDGARDALIKDASLLSRGIKEVNIAFENNEGIEIFDSNSLLIGKGISKISSTEFSLDRNNENKVVIHKDNLLIL
jgi:glutamate 5-kinase